MPSDRDGGRPSAQPAVKTRPFILSRGPDERPLQFEGEILAEAEAQTGRASILRAAIYRAGGGKFISEFSRRDEDEDPNGKAAVCNSLDEAVAWFRPGKLTTALLKQLGRWEAELLDESAAAGDRDMPSADELRILLELPNETLSAEYKGWLDLGDTSGRAVLAKAAIALANHGGGVIVLGMRERDDGPLQSIPRPPDVDPYTQDDVNQAINRFADPEFHCELSFAAHPGTGVEHAFVSVPGGMTVPVMTRRACEGVIAARKCYIRKPGPRSEEPQDAQEWRALLDRCVQAGRENMLDAIRAIVTGSVPPPRSVVGDALTVFTEASRNRWLGLVAGLPAGDPAKFPYGHYELGFEIIAKRPMANLIELRRAMHQASTVRHSGWGPFVQLSRPEYEPRIIGDAIEAWLGLPVDDRLLERLPAHCDFWRADASGRLVLLRGYDEDSVSNVEPGKWTDVTLPIWRVGEAILYIGRLAELFGENPTFLVRGTFHGLRGRVLTSIDRKRMIFEQRRCADSEVRVERQMTRFQARDNLVEVLHALLSPLYERFSFFELPDQLVAEEVDRMVRGRF